MVPLLTDLTLDMPFGVVIEGDEERDCRREVAGEMTESDEVVLEAVGVEGGGGFFALSVDMMVGFV